MTWLIRSAGMVCVVALLSKGGPSAVLQAQRVATDNGRSPRTAMAEALLAKPVTFSFDQIPLSQAIRRLAAASGIQVTYQRELVDAISHPVTLHATHVTVGEAFAQLFVGTPLRLVAAPDGQFAVVRNTMVVTDAVNGTITGRVVDAVNRRPLRGAKIGLDAVERVAESADDGTFRLTGVVPGGHTVTVKLLGYTRAVQSVTVEDNGSVAVVVVLTRAAGTLDQVVVTGTVIPTELKAVPNAMTVITAKEIEQRGITHIDQLFRGEVPGLFALNQASNSGLNPVIMFSRGATALTNSSAGTALLTNPIKTYVDGVELADPEYLSQIDPKSIERIEMITGPQASTIYGSNAINGVMQIFTKRGTTSTPQLTLSLLSGWVENNFSSALTPQHDYSAELSGVEGRLAYNAGASWNYMGRWTPGIQNALTGGFGAVKMQFPTTAGHITTEVTIRRAVTENDRHGGALQVQTAYQESGWFSVSPTAGLVSPSKSTLIGQTLGFTLGYTPNNWWVHDFEIGQDASDTDVHSAAPGHLTASDTGLFLSQTHADRRSLRYTTTVRVPIMRWTQATITGGADAWQKLTSTLDISPQTLTGTLSGTARIAREPEHNRGGFVQTQIAIADQLFLTYGLRAEWNPNFGPNVQPNVAPRYGMAFTWQMGAATAKVRANYGRSTRPPGPRQQIGDRASTCGLGAQTVADFGDFYCVFPNPDLGPEYQQGGEGGLELYVGARGTLVITRYNQTVEHLIAQPKVDSVRSLLPNPPSGGSYTDINGYAYRYQSQNLNVGNLRNQGWELQGSVNVGPFTTRGTYSWTKSRTIGSDPRYRTVLTQPQYVPGARFQNFPEHTGAVGVTYMNRQTTLTLNVTRTGQSWPTLSDAFSLRNLSSNIRLLQNRITLNAGRYTSSVNGYALADLTVSRRIGAHLESVLQFQNLTNAYVNEYNAGLAVLGRQTKLGARVR